MKTLTDVDVRARLHARADGLGEEVEGRWGTMSVDQMLWHLNTGLRSALGEVEHRSIDSLLSRTVLKWMALFGPWPRGKVRTNREMVALGRYHFEEELRELHRLIDEVGTRDVTVAWPRNAVFGPMSGWQWCRLEFRHVDYHLTQFGV
jgi:hypothetical protein